MSIATTHIGAVTKIVTWRQLEPEMTSNTERTKDFMTTPFNLLGMVRLMTLKLTK